MLATATHFNARELRGRADEQETRSDDRAEVQREEFSLCAESPRPFGLFEKELLQKRALVLLVSFESLDEPGDLRPELARTRGRPRDRAKPFELFPHRSVLPLEVGDLIRELGGIVRDRTEIAAPLLERALVGARAVILRVQVCCRSTCPRRSRCRPWKP